MTLADLTIPASARRRTAYQKGYSARLAGQSRYASPYADAIERAQAEGRRPGWVCSQHASWVQGWEAADSLCDA